MPKPSKKTATKAQRKDASLTHEQIYLLEQGELFSFYVDKVDQLLVSLSDILESIKGARPSAPPKEETDSQAYREIYRMFLDDSAIFGIESIGSKQIDGRWFVTPKIAKEGCMIVARIGDTAQIRKRAKALSKLLLSTNFDDVVEGQLRAIYEHQTSGR